jgi:hypothetical protein
LSAERKARIPHPYYIAADAGYALTPLFISPFAHRNNGDALFNLCSLQ